MHNYIHGPKRDPYCDVHPRRRQGHPRHRWGDYVNRFCQHYWPDQCNHWFDVLCQDGMQAYEDMFIEFCKKRNQDDANSDNDID